MKSVQRLIVRPLIAAVGLTFGLYASAGDDAMERQIDANYSADKARCEMLSGAEKEACFQQARSNKAAAEQKAENIEDRREADYNMAKEKCDALSGAEEDACEARAKAQYEQ